MNCRSSQRLLSNCTAAAAALPFIEVEAHTTGASRLIRQCRRRPELGFAIALQGTSSGEHGIGHGKMAALVAEHGPIIRVMAAIKRAIDPHNIMNPGRIFNLAEAPPFN